MLLTLLILTAQNAFCSVRNRCGDILPVEDIPRGSLSWPSTGLNGRRYRTLTARRFVNCRTPRAGENGCLALVKAAEQIASREFPCDLMEPGKLRESVDEIRAAIRASRQGDENNALVAALHAALEELTERQRQAIYLLYWKAMTIERRRRRWNVSLKPLSILNVEGFIHFTHCFLRVVLVKNRHFEHLYTKKVPLV